MPLRFGVLGPLEDLMPSCRDWRQRSLTWLGTQPMSGSAIPAPQDPLAPVDTRDDFASWRIPAVRQCSHGVGLVDDGLSLHFGV